MTALWLGAGLLALAVAWFLARPLMVKPDAAANDRAAFDLTVFRDQLDEVERDLERGLLDDDAAEAARIEIQRRILAADAATPKRAAENPASAAGSSRLAAALVAFGVPAAALALYLDQGMPGAPNVPFAERGIAQQTRAASAGAEQHDGGVDGMLGRLAERLLRDPEDIDGWLLLGRSYVSQRRFDDAMNAFRRARGVANGRPDVEIAYAEALILTNDMNIPPEAVAVFEQVHERAPFEPKSRYYLGLKKAQEGDVEAALQDWTDLLALSPLDAPWVPLVKQQVVRASDELNIDPLSLEPSAAAQALMDSAALPDSVAEVTGRPAPAPVPDNISEVLGRRAPAAEPAAPPPGPTREQMQAAQEMSAADRSEMIRGMVQRLADRLKDEPDDLEGWRRLERAYRVLGETAKAQDAAEQVKRLSQ